MLWKFHIQFCVGAGNLLLVILFIYSETSLTDISVWHNFSDIFPAQKRKKKKPWQNPTKTHSDIRTPLISSIKKADSKNAVMAGFFSLFFFFLNSCNGFIFFQSFFIAQFLISRFFGRIPFWVVDWKIFLLLTFCVFDMLICLCLVDVFLPSFLNFLSNFSELNFQTRTSY